MKAITIYQPYASLIATEHKIYETRTWPTKYRGPIAIHAGQYTTSIISPPLSVWRELENCFTDYKLRKELPRGAVIATAELVNVWRIVYHPGINVNEAKYIPIGAESLATDKHAPDFGDFFVPTEKEKAFGMWEPGNYAWELRNVKILPEPIPAKGKQGLWNWEAENYGEDDEE